MKKINWSKVKASLTPRNWWKKLKPYLTWKMGISFGIAWIITNGWAYLMFGAGIYWEIQWMKTVSGAYIAFLFFPFTIEKPITIAIAIFLHKTLFGHKPILPQKNS
jgi:biotin transporter BioY